MNTERLPWFPCYPSKLLGALSAMKPHEGYVYTVVCLRIYEVNGPCPDSLEALCRRTGYNRRQVSDALDLLFRSGKLVREGAGIMNPFADTVIASTKEHREKLSQAGRDGGLEASRKRKENQTPPSSQAIASVQPASSISTLTFTDSLFPEGGNRLLAEPIVDLEADLFRRGKSILGQNAGGMIKRLLDANGGSVGRARAAIERASCAENPRQFIGAMIGERGGKKVVNGIAALARDLMESDDDGHSGR